VEDGAYHLLIVSAASSAELDRASRAVAAKLVAGHALAHLARKLRAEDRALAHRRFLVASDEADAILLTSAHRDTVCAPGAGAAAFVFCDERRWPQAGRELYVDEPVFRATLDACGSRSGRGERGAAALFGVQVALAALLVSWGVTPSRVAGHGAGSVAAGYVRGTLSLHDALGTVGEVDAAPAADGALRDVARTLLAHHVLVEVGPGHSLARLDGSNGSIATLGRPGVAPEHARLLQALGLMWSRGLAIDWAAVYGEHASRGTAAAPREDRDGFDSGYGRASVSSCD
jgi:acyl transferase domain-containing protein